MDPKCSASLLLVLLLVVGNFAQDVSQKSSSKMSDSKAKLARSELTAKPSSSVLLRDEDDPDSVSELGIIDVPPEYANETVQKDHHTYYNSTFYSDPADGRSFWINLDDMSENHVVTHDKLSDSYRQATTVELSFDFPFYGSLLRNVTIATGGFLYTGDYLHNWIAATQYIAPLMANFDTRLSTNSIIKYADNGTAFTVQWQKVFVQNREDDGAFTFQVTLLESGDIIFAYKEVPYAVSSISDSQHPVKVGLSDAYILDRAILFIRRKTVFEYNRIHITKWSISNNTALYFTALPTCISYQDCSTCLSLGANLQCEWCDSVNRCSDGIDRQRQSWLAHGCGINKISTCPDGTTTAPTGKPAHAAVNVTYTSPSSSTKVSPSATSSLSTYGVGSSTNSDQVPDRSETVAHLVHEGNSTGGVSGGAVATIVIFLAAVVLVSVWVFYAYKNPHTSSGQFLIKYRPSQWSLKKDTTVAAPPLNSRHL